MRTTIVALACAAAATAAVSVTACSSDSVFNIPVGSCMNSSDLENTQVSSVTLIDCSEEHDVEAYASMDIEGDTYPGDTAVADQAETFCSSEFESYVGVAFEQQTNLVYSYMYPTQESWDQADDREILCLLVSQTPVTGTLEGSGA